MDFKFNFIRSLRQQEKYLLWHFIFYCINNKKEKVLIHKKNSLDFIPFGKDVSSFLDVLSSCCVNISEHTLDKSVNNLGAHIIYGQFFSTVFFNGKSLILLTVNPTIFKLLQFANSEKICANFFFSSFCYAQYFFEKILQAKADTIEIRSETIKKDFNLTSAAWKSFLHRLPLTEKRLASCGYLSTCNITTNRKRSAGAPVESINIAYTKNYYNDQTKIDDIFIGLNDISSYSSTNDAFLLKGCCMCGGKLFLKEDQDGNLYVCCSNSSHFHMGTSSCSFLRLI